MDQVWHETPDTLTPFLGGLSSNTSSRWGPSRGQWEEHRQTITQLYANKTLKEAKDYMRLNHSFVASDKMYKRRIKSWGLDKKLKKHEVIAMLALRTHYQRQGSTVAFEIRGREISEANLARYTKRSHVNIRDYYGISPAEAHDMAPELVCLHIVRPMTQMTAPDDFRRFEILLHAAKSLTRGAIDSRLCRVGRGVSCLCQEEDSRWSRACVEFGLLMSKGKGLHRTNQIEEAGTAWRQAFLYLETVVHSPNPFVWLRLQAIRLECFANGHPRLAAVMNYHLLSLTERLTGNNSPQRHFALGLCRLQPEDMKFIEADVYRVIDSCWESRLHVERSLIEDPYSPSIPQFICAGDRLENENQKTAGPGLWGSMAVIFIRRRLISLLFLTFIIGTKEVSIEMVTCE